MGLQQRCLSPMRPLKISQTSHFLPKVKFQRKKKSGCEVVGSIHIFHLFFIFNKAKNMISFFIDYYTQYHKNVITLKTVCRLVSQFETFLGIHDDC